MGLTDSVKGAFDGDHADKAKNLANQHEEKIDQAVERAGDQLDERTGGKFAGQVDKGQEFIEGKTGNL